MEKFSKIGFILSIVGAAIGLGNAWKFPYLVGSNGGSAFVLLYLVFAIVVGLSIFFAEMAMGKISSSDPVAAFFSLATRHKKAWSFAGFIMVTGILVASFYTLIIGWVIKYAFLSLQALPTDLKASGIVFGKFVSSEILSQIIYFSIAFFAYFFILSRGIKGGIERINLILMPILAILLIAMLFYSSSMSGFNKALEFLLVPDFSKITTDSVLVALGLAFFTMCVGIGCIITYSSSLGNDINLFTSSLYVVFLNIIVSIVIGLIVFTFTFEFNEQPTQGVGLAFISLPTLFSKLGVVGNMLSFTFFVSLIFAGLTSAISMVEPLIFYLINKLKISRFKAILIVGGAVYVLGILCALSNIDDIKENLTFFGKGFFDILDYLSSNIMLPLGGIIIAIFVGFFVKKQSLKILFVPYMGGLIFEIWYFVLRFVTPLLVFYVMIKNL